MSPQTKQELERAARRANMSLASLLESIVTRWLESERNTDGDEAQQARLHRAASMTIGVLSGGNPRRAEQARQRIQARLASRDARSRTH